MKSVCTIFVALLVIGASSTGWPESSDVDHLQPIDLNRFAQYREVLKSKLCLTPADYGRAIARPSFTPEETVSVYSSGHARQARFQLTYLIAADNLWQRTDAGHYPERARSVRVHRIDAEIPQRTAELVSEVWLRMLSGSQQPRQTPPPQRQTISVEGTIDEFWLEREDGRALFGEIDTSIPPAGPKTKALLNLSRTLVDYCKAEPVKRPAFAAKINMQATELLSRLH